jgi:hypothetical protein
MINFSSNASVGVTASTGTVSGNTISNISKNSNVGEIILIDNSTLDIDTSYISKLN